MHAALSCIPIVVRAAHKSAGDRTMPRPREKRSAEESECYSPRGRYGRATNREGNDGKVALPCTSVHGQVSRLIDRLPCCEGERGCVVGTSFLKE